MNNNTAKVVITENILIVPTTGCGAISDGGTCFSYSTSTGINWVDARLQCVTRGYDLATVTSLEENTLIYSLSGGSDCWIGYNDRYIEGTFIWADGSINTYTRWLTGEPNDGSGNEDCVIIHSTGYWNDARCTALRPCYLCSATGKILSMYILFSAVKVILIECMFQRFLFCEFLVSSFVCP